MKSQACSLNSARTGWYPWRTRPVRVGWYELRGPTVDSGMPMFWNGDHWGYWADGCITCANGRHWVLWADDEGDEWRGLAAPA